MNAPNIDSSNVHGRGIFFDGLTTAHHDVVVELAPRTLQVHGVDGRVLAQWPYDELETLSSPDNVMRLGRARDAVIDCGRQGGAPPMHGTLVPSALDPSLFIPDLKCRRKDSALAELVACAGRGGVLRHPELALELLAAREALGSTSPGRGVAVPAIRSDEAGSAS